MKTRYRRQPLATATALFLMALATPVAAQNVWNPNAANSNWQDADNWSEGIPTSAGNDVWINSSANAPVIDGGPAASAANVYVGLEGGSNASLTIRNGGKLSNESGTIGAGTGSIGNVTVDGPSSWSVTDSLTVGAAGKGALLVVNGGSVESERLMITNNTGAIGTVTVDGQDSFLNTAFLVAGNGGNGTLSVVNGAFVRVLSSFVGIVNGGVGIINVDGPGSALQSLSDFELGIEFGSGTANIVNGGTLDSGRALIGSYESSTGVVNVDGAGSRWTSNDGALVIGNMGTGTVNIRNGGTVQIDTIYLGQSVDGSGDPIDGPQGTGTLNIGAGAGETAVAAGTLQAASLVFGAGTGVLNFNHTGNVDGSDVVFDAVISGTGTVNQTGPGTTVLTGENTYAGLTRVSGGELQVDGSLAAQIEASVSGNGTLSGSGAIAGHVFVKEGGTLRGEQGRTLTMGDLSLQSDAIVSVALGIVGGNGLFHVTDDLELDGTLEVSDLGGFGAGVYRLFDYDGTLTDNGLEIGATPSGIPASDLSVQTSVANHVSLVSLGGQTLGFWDGGDSALHNNGAIDGGGGVWQAQDSANWTVANGTVNGDARPQPIFAIFQGPAGTVTVDQTTGVVEATGLQFASDGYRLDGDALGLTDAQSVIRVGDGSAASSGYTATITNELTGTGGLAKTDLGTLVLSGENTYTGATQVAAGTLAVNGSIAASSLTTVAAGARLQGIGTVGNTTVQGTVAPGNSIGTLHVAGNYIQSADSTYEVEIDPNGASDRLDITGTAALAGTVSVSKAAGTYLPGTHYTILNASGGITGAYAALTQNRPFVNLALNYSANQVSLDVGRNTIAFCDVAATANQCATGRGAESLGSGGVYDAIVALSDSASAQAAFDALSGELHASTRGALREQSSDLRNATAQRDTHQAGGFWTQGLGAWGHVRNDGNAARLETDRTGLLLGADWAIGEGGYVGVAGGYGQGSVKVNERHSSTDINTLQVGVYGGLASGRVGLDAGIGYARHRLDSQREVAFAGYSDHLEADYDAQTLQAYLRGTVQLNEAVSGFIEAASVDVKTDGFQEKGGAAALTVQDDSTKATYATVGVRLDLPSQTGPQFHGSLGWRQRFGGDDQAQATGQFEGGQPFTVLGAQIGRKAFVGDVGLDWSLTPNSQLSLSYAGAAGGGAADNRIDALFSMKF